MGTRGPAPKRSDQRRRENKPSQEIVEVYGAAQVERPRVNSQWHPVAKRWFESLAFSGQSRFYEPSDWAAAYVLAESISRELKPQVVGVTDEGEAVRAHVPPKGASLAAWLKGMTALLVTEGDRRRASVELQRPITDSDEGDGDVSWIDDARRRLRESS